MDKNQEKNENEIIKNNYGELNIVLGPMYSGKSTELLRIYNKFKRKYNILVINHKSDDRYGKNNVYTHNEEKLNCVSLDELVEFNRMYEKEYIDSIDVILIDEGQFFKDLYVFCKHMTDKQKKIIYVFGLSGDFERKKFGQLIDLIPLADNIKHIKSICNLCRKIRNAPFTMRKTSNKEQISVGSFSEYLPVCRNCWLNNFDKDIDLINF